MHGHLLPIGEVSRRSGLTISALRFYDREGVLPAAHVDPTTGYRRYVPRAGVLLPPTSVEAVLRAVGAPGATTGPRGQVVGLAMEASSLRLSLPGDDVETDVDVLEADFPDVRSLVDMALPVPEGHGVDGPSEGGPEARTLRLDELRRDVALDAPPQAATSEAVAAGETCAEVVELEGGHLASRPFLREALDGVGPRGQLGLPGAIGPLVLANDDGTRVALVMPLRPEGS